VTIAAFDIRGMGFSGGVLYGLQVDPNAGGKGGGGGGQNVLFTFDPSTGATENLGLIGRNLRNLAPIQ